MLREIYIPDSTVLAKGSLSKALERDDPRIRGKIVVHSLLVLYFERLAREGRSQGFIGLQELEKIRGIIKDKYSEEEIVIEETRELPQGYHLLRDENIDIILRELAKEWNATLITSDKTQYKACIAEAVKVIYLKADIGVVLSFEKMFPKEAMSLHIKENVPPYAKVGKPGKWSFIKLREEPMLKKEIEELITEILEVARSLPDAFIEIDRPGSTIVQLRHYRIVITKPPFSDGYELTIVRPLVKLSIEDYKLPKKLLERLEKRAEGILIAGAPGMGKTTFAQALAEFYMRKNKVVKTIESPRDMHLPPQITQYSKAYATSEEIHDVLLLSRPDYTVFDEMRDTKDFELFADLRLAGVGMIGVVHATTPIDAIQRFIGRVELGMIPSIIDTVIFITNGEVSKVYELETVVKVPYGLKEEDLARPVVVVRDFFTGEPEYELYVFGERTFVVPIKKKVAERRDFTRILIERTIRKYVPDAEFDIVIHDTHAEILIPAEIYNYVLKRCRKRLDRLGKKLGIRISLKPKIIQ
ncbi:MAG: ATPase [Thermoprotei archaeon]|nr:MAG: ATPase [Thermoprotei archaeon]